MHREWRGERTETIWSDTIFCQFCRRRRKNENCVENFFQLEHHNHRNTYEQQQIFNKIHTSVLISATDELMVQHSTEWLRGAFAVPLLDARLNWQIPSSCFRVPIQPLFSFHLAVDVDLAYIYGRQMRPFCCLPRLKIALTAVTAAGLMWKYFPNDASTQRNVQSPRLPFLRELLGIMHSIKGNEKCWHDVKPGRPVSSLSKA